MFHWTVEVAINLFIQQFPRPLHNLVTLAVVRSSCLCLEFLHISDPIACPGIYLAYWNFPWSILCRRFLEVSCIIAILILSKLVIEKQPCLWIWLPMLLQISLLIGCRQLVSNSERMWTIMAIILGSLWGLVCPRKRSMTLRWCYRSAWD